MINNENLNHHNIEEINESGLKTNEKDVDEGNSWGKILLIPILAFFLYHFFNYIFTLLILNNEPLQRLAFGSSSLFVFGGYFYFFGIRSSKNGAEGFGLSPISFGNPKWLIYGFLIILTYVIFGILIMMPFSQFWNILFNESVFSKENLSTVFWIELLVIGFVAPISEELFFRGFVYSSIRNKVGVTKGVILSAFIFGIVHLSILQGLLAFIISIPLAYLYEKSKSLYVPIFLHVLSNVLIHFTSAVFEAYWAV
ncbi:lysostaphin resistance A-like protein [Candidatus Lokiarchaeum ossiferum]|uniref:lysostaphin resistance A-like protein n=1 Tax=Candidatus Lokiarchaeum ossiferum TaxID=2951803 RepID=UPI00352BEBCE